MLIFIITGNLVITVSFHYNKLIGREESQERVSKPSQFVINCFPQSYGWVGDLKSNSQYFSANIKK